MNGDFEIHGLFWPSINDRRLVPQMAVEMIKRSTMTPAEADKALFEISREMLEFTLFRPNPHQ